MGHIKAFSNRQLLPLPVDSLPGQLQVWCRPSVVVGQRCHRPIDAAVPGQEYVPVSAEYLVETRQGEHQGPQKNVLYGRQEEQVVDKSILLSY